jgi:cobalt-zinc-cadmium efflux system membrane fusion protein
MKLYSFKEFLNHHLRRRGAYLLCAALACPVPASYAQRDPENGDHRDHEEHAAEEDEHGPDEEVVNLSDEVLREFGVELTEVGPGTLRKEVILPGEIQYNREQIAFVTPRYSGTVQNIRVRLADKVRKGDVLAVLESNETLQPFEVKAPLDGTVVAFDLTPGQSVDAGTPVFTVADLSSVWADLRIYQRDIGTVREGQMVEIAVGRAFESYSGEIAYVAPAIDEHTRTGLARVVMADVTGRWMPGMFVRATVAVENRAVNMLIPRTAVMTFEGRSVVFLRTGRGLEPRPVKLGASDSNSYEVVAGLHPGDTIVTANALTIKAELEKGSFGDGHNH